MTTAPGGLLALLATELNRLLILYNNATDHDVRQFYKAEIEQLMWHYRVPIIQSFPVLTSIAIKVDVK